MSLDLQRPVDHEKALFGPHEALPSWAEAQAEAARSGQDAIGVMAAMHAARNRRIREQEHDPLQKGFVPPIWRLCWGLLDVPWQDKELNALVRRALGFEYRVRTLVLLGGNGSAKTYFGLKTLMLQAFYGKEQNVWSFDFSHQQSVDIHHKYLWKLLPPELRRKIIEPVTNISYGSKDGFTRSKFVLPNGSSWEERNYTQNRDAACESGKPNAVFGDELMPKDWAERLEVRTARQGGYFILGQTPTTGYTPTVYYYYHGSQVVTTAPAFLLPRDGGPADEAAQLGLTAAEYAENRAAMRRGEKPLFVACRPAALEQLLGLEGYEREEKQKAESGKQKAENGTSNTEHRTSNIEVKATVKVGKREFAAMPRVLKTGVNKDKAIVHFWSCDNPFIDQAAMLATVQGMSEEQKKISYYGYCEKTIANAFPMFNERVHVF